VYVCMGVWVYRCIGVCVYGCMGAWGCMGVWVYGCGVRNGAGCNSVQVHYTPRIQEDQRGSCVCVYRTTGAVHGGVWVYRCMGV